MFNGATGACVFLAFTKWITTAEKSDGATIRRNNVLSLTQISNDHKCHPAVTLHCGHAGRVTLPVKRLQWRANAEWAVPRFLARPRGPRKPRGPRDGGQDMRDNRDLRDFESAARHCGRLIEAALPAKRPAFNHLTSKPETRNTKLSHLQTLKLSNPQTFKPSNFQTSQRQNHIDLHSAL